MIRLWVCRCLPVRGGTYFMMASILLALGLPVCSSIMSRSISSVSSRLYVVVFPTKSAITIGDMVSSSDDSALMASMSFGVSVCNGVGWSGKNAVVWLCIASRTGFESLLLSGVARDVVVGVRVGVVCRSAMRIERSRCCRCRRALRRCSIG